MNIIDYLLEWGLIDGSWCPFVKWEEHETKQVADCFLIKFNLLLNLINHSIGLCALTVLFLQDWQCKYMVESWSYNREISLLDSLLFSFLGIGDSGVVFLDFNSLQNGILWFGRPFHLSFYTRTSGIFLVLRHSTNVTSLSNIWVEFQVRSGFKFPSNLKS
jgi:hypothetical protein